MCAKPLGCCVRSVSMATIQVPCFHLNCQQTDKLLMDHLLIIYPYTCIYNNKSHGTSNEAVFFYFIFIICGIPGK